MIIILNMHDKEQTISIITDKGLDCLYNVVF